MDDPRACRRIRSLLLCMNLMPKFFASMHGLHSFLFSPFPLIPPTTILSETHLAYPLVSFPLVVFLSSDPLSPPSAFTSDHMTDPVFLPSPDQIHKTSFFL